ncbi:MAG TPA: gliding motility-associated C-terminal domain-containing protein [Dyadobacter sp.]|jgi:gliding motility-associated-like protein|nr:gliding motility-associated C-terminal domain-containing protein [Dyadobacter sp.]
MRAALWLIFFVNLLLSRPVTGQTLEHAYRFYETLSISAPECADDLTQIRSGGNCNTSSSPGSYTDDAPPCRIERKVYHTNANWGLRYSNKSGVIGSSYTISMYVHITNWGNGRARILDFSDGAEDDGIYFAKAPTGSEYCLFVSGQGAESQCPFFNTNNYYLLTFTRDAQTGILSVYVNNTLFIAYNDAAGKYISSEGKPVNLFADDRVNSCESAEVNFAYVYFGNTPTPRRGVERVYADICYIANINSAADFIINPNPSCGFPENIRIAYSGSIPATNSAYSFEWNWDGGKVVSGSGRGPYQIAWDTPGKKDVSLVIKRTDCTTGRIENTKIAEISSLDLTTEVVPPTCTDPTAVVTVTPVGGNGPFQFSIDSVNFQTDPNFRIQADNYRIFIKDAGNCVVGRDLNIDGITAIQVQTIADTAICEGESVTLFTTSNSDLHGWLPATGLDNAAAKDPVAVPAATTTYIVTAGSEGCLQRDTVTIRVVPKVEITVTPDTVIEEGVPLQLEATSAQLDLIPGSTYQWFPPAGLSNTQISDPIATLLSGNTYTVKGTTPEGCSAQASVRITVSPPDWIVVPTAFSPNGDGKNDILYLVTKGIKAFSYLRIYNRWGQVVYATNDIAAGWDGRFKGAEPVAGVYTFELSGVSNRDRVIRKKGSVLLLR